MLLFLWHRFEGFEKGRSAVERWGKSHARRTVVIFTCQRMGKAEATDREASRGNFGSYKAYCNSLRNWLGVCDKRDVVVDARGVCILNCTELFTFDLCILVHL